VSFFKFFSFLQIKTKKEKGSVKKKKRKGKKKKKEGHGAKPLNTPSFHKLVCSDTQNWMSIVNIKTS
jgi:hypothetical protein